MENLEFTDHEIRDQLGALGYFDVSETRIKQFRRDLQRLVDHDRSSGSSSWFTGISSPSTNSDGSPVTNQQKAGLSRYQPHVKVSPRATEPSTFATSASTSRPQTAETSSGADASTVPRFTTTGYDTLTMPSTSLDPRTTVTTTTTDDARSSSNDRHHVSTDDVTDPDSFESSLTPDMRSSQNRKIIRKRKVVRKQTDGTSAVFDESLVESDNGNSYRVHDIGVNYNQFKTPMDLPPRPQSARPAWKQSQDSIHEPLPSYIRPNTSHPHTRNLKKTDPVNRYHQYRDAWNSVKAPGEKSHHDLRWEIKAQMMYKDEILPKPQRVYVPNTYVVPTSKKRSALRWEVRHAMERGLPIPSTFNVM